MVIIGLMSGTSADGIDAAVVDIRGQGRRTRIKLLDFIYIPYSIPMRQAILGACDAKQSRSPDICALDAALGQLFGEAAIAAADRAGVTLRAIAAIASHGQTIWHQPQSRPVGDVVARGTLQIGNPAVIAARTGCRVISDFRSADMAAGGQGAPLVPYFDWALLTSPAEPRAVLNIGGIANITYLRHDAALEDVRAFDTGPGNMVIDRLAWRLSDGAVNMDVGGKWAARGETNPRLLNRLLNHPFLWAEPPKSTGRETFGQAYADKLWREAASKGIRAEDLLATVTDLTATSINLAFWRQWIGEVNTLIVGGGGAKNKTLMRMLAIDGRRQIARHEDFGIPDDAKEAVAFALLGYETLHGRPSNVPAATGASRPVVLGSITPPQA